MKPSLQIKLGQQLTLTPQLRLAIRLLQLSSLELEQELSQALESNPLLEREDEASEEGPEPGSADAPTEIVARDEGDGPGEEFDEAPDFRWDDESSGSGSGSGAGLEGEEREDLRAAPQDLHEHLCWQLGLSHLSPRDQQIGAALIDAIGEDGYLEGSIQDIQAALSPQIVADKSEIETMLALIQHFDPVGVGARSLSECLLVQMSLLDPSTPGLQLARCLAAGHLEVLAKLGPAKLAQQLQVSAAALDEAVALLRSLDPRPGSRIGGSEAEFIVPDAIAYRQRGVWKVATHNSNQPRLGINRHYERLIGSNSREDDSYLRAQLQEARWLIKSLETRADTLLRVARSIVRQQSGFLEHGAQAMRPLTLREVAEELGLHESTISRATTRKYLRTPRGTFEFKYFFGSGIATDGGGHRHPGHAAPTGRRGEPARASFRRQTGRNTEIGRHPRGPENCGKVPGSDEYSFFHGATASLAERQRHDEKRQSRGVKPCESRSADTRWKSPRRCGITRSSRSAGWPSTSTSIWTPA
jgi:RNA polymerase sigma-54 factor